MPNETLTIPRYDASANTLLSDRRRDPSRIAHIALSEVLSLDHEQASLFASAVKGPDLILPTNFMSTESNPIVLPSLEVVTAFRRSKASIVDIHSTNKDLEAIYEDAVGAAAGVRDRVTGMLYETVVRIIDTNGAQGLHHVHNTRFPNTVYQVVKKGSGVVPNVYVTRLGEREDKTPVFGLITATKDKQAEYKLFRAMGAGSQKKKRSA